MPARTTTPRRWLTPAVAVVITAGFAAPFAYLVSKALGDWSASWEVLSSEDTIGPLWRSLQLAGIVTVLATMLGVTMAWCTQRTDLPAATAWRVAAVLPLVIPSFVGAYSFVSAFSAGGLIEQVTGWTHLPDVRGLTGAVIVLTALTYPYVYLPVAARLSALPPSLEEGARLLGRSPLQVVRTIVAPQVATSVLAGSLLVALYCLSDFGAVQFVGYDTLTRKIYAARLDPVTSVAMSLLLGVLALTVAAGERVVRHRLPAGATVTVRRAVRYRLGRWKVFAVAAMGTVVSLTLLGPIAVVTWWVIRGRRSGGRRSRVVDLPEVTWSSAWAGVVAAVLAVAIVLPLAFVVVRRGGRFGGALSTVVMAAFALPGIVIALSLVRMFSGTAAYQTFAVLFLAYVIHFGGQALGASQAAVAGVSTRLDEAAQLLGAGRWRRFWTVDLRLMLPGLAAGGGLVMLSVLKELPATLMLRPIGFNTLATRINATVEEALLIDAGQLSLVLVALSGVLTWLLVVRRMEHLGQ
jgi:iron(III) transport system permease protein